MDNQLDVMHLFPKYIIEINHNHFYYIYHVCKTDTINIILYTQIYEYVG